MATKAAQLAEWLKELQDRVDADGNLSYAEIMRFQQEKNLTKKQFDSIFTLLHEHHIELVYDDDIEDDAEEGPTDADFDGDPGDDDLSDDVLLDDKDGLEEKEWETDNSDEAYDAAAGGISDPVRLYLRECGSNPLLSAEEEMRLAKLIERGKHKDATEEEKEEEKQNESKLDRWLDEHAGPKVQSALMTLSACAGVVLAIFLFTFLPTFLTGLVAKVIPMGRWPRVILEAVLKLAIFLGYMFLCTRMKEIHRMFQYHGAEHKTIACYEAGEELTVANIRRHTRFHPRCGTSFLILVILVSIVLYAVLPWSGTMLRVLYKLAMLPLLVGICYEILKWAGRSNSLLARAVSVPGLWLQHLTTFEPEDDMIEVAIAAVTPVLPKKPEDGQW